MTIMHTYTGNCLARILMRHNNCRMGNYAMQRGFASGRPGDKKAPESVAEEIEFPRRIFSGIQPTGSLHLGNYLGAIKKWTELQNQNNPVFYCIVDMHSITLPQDPIMLRDNILKIAATMIACGISPEKATIFVQSSIKEHTELSWILSCITTMARLGHLPQFKEKTRSVKDIPLGIFIYPVLQAADIMLYKSTHVPVGEDQVQHIQLAQHLGKIFNTRFGTTFPICHAIVEESAAARIRSLRDPTKKMSKSDPDPKATIHILDQPEAIVEKIKKAMTDFISDVNYDPIKRGGVSNLIAIHSLVTGISVEKIIEESKNIDTGKYKLRVADAVIEHLAPIREDVNKQLENSKDLIFLLERGAERARRIAVQTMSEVHQKMGLGMQNIFIQPAIQIDFGNTEARRPLRQHMKSKPVKFSINEDHNLMKLSLPQRDKEQQKEKVQQSMDISSIEAETEVILDLVTSVSNNDSSDAYNESITPMASTTPTVDIGISKSKNETEESDSTTKVTEAY